MMIPMLMLMPMLDSVVIHVGIVNQRLRVLALDRAFGRACTVAFVFASSVTASVLFFVVLAREPPLALGRAIRALLAGGPSTPSSSTSSSSATSSTVSVTLDFIASSPHKLTAVLDPESAPPMDSGVTEDDSRDDVRVWDRPRVRTEGVSVDATDAGDAELAAFAFRSR